MKVAIIDTGNIGGTLARSLSEAGHDIVLGARDPGKVADLAAATGATVAEVTDAAAQADAVVVAIPFGNWPSVADAIGVATRQKVVIDAGNPYPERDGAMADDAVADGRGSAETVAALLPEARVAKTFNTLYWRDLADLRGTGIAMAVAADDPVALDTAETLVRDAGFKPVSAGGLAASARFDPGTPAYGKAMSADALRDALGK